VTTTTEPKTITLYGRGERRYPIVPRVWEHCMDRAREQKAWAAQANNPKWKAGACDMSRDMLDHFLTTDEMTLAQERYRYLEMRAHLGNPQVWDRPARKLWMELGGRIRRPKKTVSAV
jgi:hypothetical protein